jgi:hypothetical protein
MSLAFIIRIYHDARSSECQIHGLVFNGAQNNYNSPSKYAITKDGVWNTGLSAALGVGLWPLACWNYGFESRRGHGYLS